MFIAAKQLITTGLINLKTELGEDASLIEKETAFQIFNMAYSKSKLSSDSYLGAIAKGDDKIYLLRSDSSLVEKFGFRSQANYKELLKKIPGYKKLRTYLITLDTEYFNTTNATKKAEIVKKWKEYSEKIKSGDSAAIRLFNQYLFSRIPEFYKQKLTPDNIEKTFSEVASLYHLFVEKILMSKYQQRGILVEYEREFIDYHLQMIGSTPEKPGKSFSSNSSLYMGTYNNSSIPFTNNKSHNSIFLVEIDRSEIAWNEYSIFSSEYEFVSTKYISSQQIVDQMTQDRFKEKISLPTEKLQKLKPIFGKFGFGGSLAELKTDEKATSKP